MDYSEADTIHLGASSWHRTGKQTVASRVSAKGNQLYEDDSPRRTEISLNLRRYNGRSLRGLFASFGTAADESNRRINITKSAIDTLVSKIGSSKPRPRVVTDGGDYEARQTARQLQRFIDASFSHCNVHELGKLAFRDGMLADAGVLHAYGNVGKGKVCVERVFPAELMVDPISAADGCPQEMFRVKFVSVDALASAVPASKRAAVMTLPVVGYDDLPDYQRDLIDGQPIIRESCRMVKVFEAWHLATWGLDGKMIPGRHVMAAGNISLLDEEYEYDTFPFAVFYWNKPVRGFWGDSAAGEIRGIEGECNVLLQKVQRAMRLAGQPWIIKYADGGGGTPKLTDQVGLEIECSAPGLEPKIVTHSPVAPDLMNQVMQLRALAFEQLGTNEHQVAAVKPPGIESGRGLEQLSEEHLVRFKDAAQTYERFVAYEVTRILIQAAGDLDKKLKEQDRKGFQVRGTVANEMVKINWSECAMSPEDYTITMWPTSTLPLTPAARHEEIQRLMEMGLISPQTAARLLDMPDLDEERELLTASEDFVDWQLSEMLEHGRVAVPSERQDLQLSAARATRALLRATRKGTNPDHLLLVEEYIDQILAMMQPPAPIDPGLSGPAPLTPPEAVQGPGLLGPGLQPAAMPGPGAALGSPPPGAVM